MKEKHISPRRLSKTNSNHEQYSWSQIQNKVIELERFRDEEIKPFMDKTTEQLEVVVSEQEEQKERFSDLKVQLKELERRLSWGNLKEIGLIGLGIFLIMYIIIKLLI